MKKNKTYHTRLGYEQLYRNICRDVNIKPANTDKWLDVQLLNSINMILELNKYETYSHDEMEAILDELAK